MTEHLKEHPYKWERFMTSIQDSLNLRLNSDRLVKKDNLKSNDLKLAFGISHHDSNIVLRLPKSRVSRRRFQSTRWKGSTFISWNRKISDEYQNNHIGGYQGNFDKPICNKEVEWLNCGNWLINFQEFVSYRHEPRSACRIFSITRKSMKVWKID